MTWYVYYVWFTRLIVVAGGITGLYIIIKEEQETFMGWLGDIFSQAAGQGSTDSGGGVDRSDKEQTRKHYEKEEKKMTPEEQERAKPPKDEPRDGKVW